MTRDPSQIINRKPYYPVLIDLQGKKVVVVGGGQVAQRKIETLMEYGAAVHVVSKQLTPTLQGYAESGRIQSVGQEFLKDYLDNAVMVIAATDDPLLNHNVSECAKAKGLLINAVDQPSDCSFIVPSILRRGDLLVAVSTSGKSPALAKKIREDLEKVFGNEYESFLVLMGRLRKEILALGLAQEENRQIFQKLVESPVLDALRREDWRELASILSKILDVQLSPDQVRGYSKVA